MSDTYGGLHGPSARAVVGHANVPMQFGSAQDGFWEYCVVIVKVSSWIMAQAH